MGKKVYRKFVWVIKDFSSLQSEQIYSETFVRGGCKWQLVAYPEGNDVDYLSLYLEEVADWELMHFGWRRKTYFRLTIVNQLSKKRSVREETEHWFDGIPREWGFESMIPLHELHAEDGGFLVNGELIIVAKVNVLDVIGRLDVSGESDDASEEGLEYDDDSSDSEEGLDYDDVFEEGPDDNTLDYAWNAIGGLDVPGESGKETKILSKTEESMNVNGFQVLPSQVELVRRIFERHPDVASEVRLKNQHLRTTFMNFLLSIIETLCQSPQEFSNEDLVEASVAVSYETNTGFKLHWLQTMLEEVLKKKKRVDTCEHRLREMEEELQKLDQRSSELDVLVKKEKADVSAANVPLSFDDVV